MHPPVSSIFGGSGSCLTARLRRAEKARSLKNFPSFFQTPRPQDFSLLIGNEEGKGQPRRKTQEQPHEAGRQVFARKPFRCQDKRLEISAGNFDPLKPNLFHEALQGHRCEVMKVPWQIPTVPKWSVNPPSQRLSIGHLYSNPTVPFQNPIHLRKRLPRRRKMFQDMAQNDQAKSV